MDKIGVNRERLLSEISRIHKSSFYKSREIPKMIAVSKQQEIEKVLEALKNGQKIFGENRVQEAEKKWTYHLNIKKDIELHLIGALQSNKVKKALNIFDVIHTLDRESLAFEIHKNLEKSIRTRSFFIQVNTGEEKQKSGVLPSELEEFFDLCTKKLKIPVIGLMCIPPLNEPSSIHFCYLNKLSQKFKLNHLSMGMSSDYDEAIKFGATYVRIGTEFFGKRKNQI